MVEAPAKCDTCGARCTLIQAARSPDELMWICNDNSSKGHFKKTLHAPARSSQHQAFAFPAFSGVHDVYKGALMGTPNREP